MSPMTDSGQTQKEATDLTKSLATPKHVRIASWNVRTMHETGKTAQITREMSRYNIQLLGISEMRWANSGKIQLSSGETVIYSGRADERHEGGVGLIMNKTTKKSLMEWEPVNDRIIRARFFSKFAKTTILQCYAPTDVADEKDKEDFYTCLQQQIDRIPRHDIALIMGDMNAKVGSDNSGYEECMGKHGMGDRTDNGERFANICL